MPRLSEMTIKELWMVEKQYTDEWNQSIDSLESLEDTKHDDQLKFLRVVLDSIKSEIISRKYEPFEGCNQCGKIKIKHEECKECDKE